MDNLNNNNVARLIPALPAGEFLDKPAEIDRFFVRLWPNGRIFFKGSRARIEEFLRYCTEQGLDVQVDYVSLCG